MNFPSFFYFWNHLRNMLIGNTEPAETVEESQLVCDSCGKLLGVIKWFKDLTTPCPTCSDSQSSQELVTSFKMLCIECRSNDT